MSGTFRSLLLILVSFLLILLFFYVSDRWNRPAGEPLVWVEGEPEEIPFVTDREDKFRIDVWFEANGPSAEALQVLAGQWRLHDEMSAMEAFDASDVDGLDASGFLGAIFDGRYVYYSPQHNRSGRHGVVLRFDTHQPLDEQSAWRAFDAGNIGGMSTRGYYGGAFDGRYIYFSPRFDGEVLHSRVLRYDTTGPFDEERSWSVYDPGLGVSYQGAGYDGRHVYFAPGSSSAGSSGLMLRYDSRAPFGDSSAWQTVDMAGIFPDYYAVDYDGIAFDGRWIYYVPLSTATPVRYDTGRPFDDPEAWQLFEAAGSGMEMCVGAVFDGRHIYYVPYDHHTVVRFDTTEPFESSDAWSAYDVRETDGLTAYGYDGGFFDGRFLFFIPFFHTDDTGTMNFHGELLRYDTTAPFDGPGSWRSADHSETEGLHTVGYNAGIFDGRYFYFAPWHDGEAYHDAGTIVGHSRVLRYDSLEEGSFLFRYSDYGHNGGLSGALPGPSFTINTVNGPRTVSANRVLEPGSYLLTGVYDGASVRLYIDGVLAAEQPANGRLSPSRSPLVIGGLTAESARLNGRVTRVEISR